MGRTSNTIDLFNLSSDVSLFTKMLVVLVFAITPAVFEELLFRKAIIDYLKKYGIVFAIIVSSLLFGLVHGNINQGIFAFIAGLIMGLSYLLTKDIKVTMITHALNNGIEVLILVSEENIQLAFAVISYVLLFKRLPSISYF